MAVSTPSEVEEKGSTQKRPLQGWRAERNAVQRGPRTTFPLVLLRPERLPPGVCHFCPRPLPQGILEWPQLCSGWQPKPAPAQQVWEADRETGLLSQICGSAPHLRPALCSHRPLTHFLSFWQGLDSPGSSWLLQPLQNGGMRAAGLKALASGSSCAMGELGLAKSGLRKQKCMKG